MIHYIDKHYPENVLMKSLKILSELSLISIKQLSLLLKILIVFSIGFAFTIIGIS